MASAKRMQLQRSGRAGTTREKKQLIISVLWEVKAKVAKAVPTFNSTVILQWDALVAGKTLQGQKQTQHKALSSDEQTSSLEGIAHFQGAKNVDDDQLPDNQKKAHNITGALCECQFDQIK